MYLHYPKKLKNIQSKSEFLTVDKEFCHMWMSFIFGVIPMLVLIAIAKLTQIIKRNNER